MAKKRRQKVEKKDDYDFKFPEFDEYEFMSLELRKAKASLIAFIFAIIMVIITFQLYTITYPDPRGPIVLGIFGVILLPFLTKFIKVDTSDFDWKNWVGSGAIYIMSWLAIFILVCNPPFSDFIEPDIDKDNIKFTYVKFGSNSDIWTDNGTDIDIPALTMPIKINITVKITDNTAVDKDTIKIRIKGLNTQNNYTYKMKHVKENLYRSILENPDQPGQPFVKDTFFYSIEAEDIYGHKEVIEGEFKVL